MTKNSESTGKIFLFNIQQDLKRYNKFAWHRQPVASYPYPWYLLKKLIFSYILFCVFVFVIIDWFNFPDIRVTNYKTKPIKCRKNQSFIINNAVNARTRSFLLNSI